MPRGVTLPDPPGGLARETIALERSGLDVARHLAQRLSD